jgi:putative transposase
MVEPAHGRISITRQCELLGLSRSSWYYQPKGESVLKLRLMRMIDEQYTRTPFYGSPKMAAWLRRQGFKVNHKRVERLMSLMGLYAAQPRIDTSRKHPEHKLYPYLLSGVKIAYPNQVWSADITYIRLARGFLYLVAILDWYSRFL